MVSTWPAVVGVGISTISRRSHSVEVRLVYEEEEEEEEESEEETVYIFA